MITGEKVVLRPAVAEDSDRFIEILGHPDVARWWADGPVWDPVDSVAEIFAPAPEVDTFAIVVGDDVVGLIQCYEENDPQYRHAGMDVAVDPAWHGRGIGTDALRTLGHHLIDDRGHHRLVIDPAVDNLVAIRTYRHIGFQPVGTLRRYERGADGRWHDNLLMDLLAGELA